MEAVNRILCGVAVPLLLFLSGIFFFCRIGPFFLRHPWRALGALLRGKGGRGDGTSPRRALAVAMAGTLGVGNIVGVASAIRMGGAGAVFWMWVSAALAMLLKYAEIVLAHTTRRYDSDGRPHGGAMYYIKEAFGGRVGKGLSAVFALLLVGLSLSLGGAIQSFAAADALLGVFALPRWLIGGVLAVLSAVILLCGSRRVEAVCEHLVPAVCLLFSVASLAVLVLRREALPYAFGAIFKGAFSRESVGGGVLGFLCSGAVRYGFTRGLVSNEAGCGTAPIAHAAANNDSAAEQGLLGIFEVFVDTIVLCTMTALVILVSGLKIGGEGVMPVVRAYSAVLGRAAGPLIALSVLFFAFATILSWSHYGCEALLYLTRRQSARRALILAISLSTLWGAFAAPDFIWGITDLTLGLMTVINLTALLLCHRRVREETALFLD